MCGASAVSDRTSDHTSVAAGVRCGVLCPSRSTSLPISLRSLRLCRYPRGVGGVHALINSWYPLGLRKECTERKPALICTGKATAFNKSGKEVIRALGLIPWNHVPCAPHHRVSESPEICGLLDVAGDGVQGHRGNGPHHRGGGSELVLSSPIQVIEKLLGERRAQNDVVLAGINEHLDVGRLEQWHEHVDHPHHPVPHQVLFHRVVEAVVRQAPNVDQVAVRVQPRRGVVGGASAAVALFEVEVVGEPCHVVVVRWVLLKVA
mmetsp:Transcript_56434/g.97170  ORF Transcript_56434/g.97170 Transcript_56434/m.97170 type:complete len:263 (+) Transcript_56434:194-982(+)